MEQFSIFFLTILILLRIGYSLISPLISLPSSILLSLVPVILFLATLILFPIFYPLICLPSFMLLSLIPVILSFVILIFTFTSSLILNLNTDTPIKKRHMLDTFIFLMGTYFFISMYNPSQIYLFFIFALCVTIYSDFQYFLISRFVSLYLVPCMWIGSYFLHFPISGTESVSASLTFFAFLYSVRYISLHIFKKDGLGQGDVDLITFIASFSGFLGAWFSLMFGSLLAIVCTLPQLIQDKNPKIAYGAYMALAAIVYILHEPFIKQYAYSILFS